MFTILFMSLLNYDFTISSPGSFCPTFFYTPCLVIYFIDPLPKAVFGHFGKVSRLVRDVHIVVRCSQLVRPISGG